MLYLQRGQLYVQHEQPDSAIVDYKFAISNGLEKPEVFILLAEAQLAAGELEDGLKSLAKYSLMNSDELRGIHVRAQLHHALKLYDASIADFEYVLSKTESPSPQELVQLSNLYLERDSTDFANAIDVLQRGKEKLGNIFPLELKIYFLEKKRENFKEAHLVLDQLMESLSRKERLMVEKAELYLLQKKSREAAEVLSSAEMAIAELPKRFQTNDATNKLSQRIEELKKQL